MGEAKRRREEGEKEFGETGIWTVTRGAEEMRKEMLAEKERIAGIVKGLRRCPVCGGEAKAVMFGAEGNGVWIGCDRSAECVGYIEIHTEGWSLEEVAAEWNLYNSGMYRLIRKMKRWWRKHYSRARREEKRWEEGKAAKRAEEREERERIFWGKPKKSERRWWQIWRKGNK